jgi:hypothetical protein
MPFDLSKAPPWMAGSMKNRCNTYRRQVETNTDGRGKPGNRSWEPVLVNEPYQHRATRNFSQPSVGGRIIQPSAISAEWGDFPPGLDIKDQDILRDVTPGGGLNGQVYRILGAPTVFDGIPVPEAAYQECELRQEPKIPADLPE